MYIYISKRVHILVTWPLANYRKLSYIPPQCIGLYTLSFISGHVTFWSPSVVSLAYASDIIPCTNTNKLACTCRYKLKCITQLPKTILPVLLMRFQISLTNLQPCFSCQIVMNNICQAILISKVMSILCNTVPNYKNSIPTAYWPI